MTDICSDGQLRGLCLGSTRVPADEVARVATLRTMNELSRKEFTQTVVSALVYTKSLVIDHDQMRCDCNVQLTFLSIHQTAQALTEGIAVGAANAGAGQQHSGGEAAPAVSQASSASASLAHPRNPNAAAVDSKHIRNLIYCC